MFSDHSRGSSPLHSSFSLERRKEKEPKSKSSVLGLRIRVGGQGNVSSREDLLSFRAFTLLVSSLLPRQSITAESCEGAFADDECYCHERRTNLSSFVAGPQRLIFSLCSPRGIFIFRHSSFFSGPPASILFFWPVKRLPRPSYTHALIILVISSTQISGH